MTKPRCAICGLGIHGDHFVEKSDAGDRVVHAWCLSLEVLGLIPKGDDAQ